MNLEPFFWGCIVVGAAQALAPDRWMPVSTWSWQRDISRIRRFFIILLVTSFHTALGLALFKILPGFSGSALTGGLVSLLILGIGLIRVLWFTQGFGLFTPQTKFSFLKIISWMGPAEALVPLLFWGSMRGYSLLEALFGFFTGTFLMVFGMVSVFMGMAKNPHQRVLVFSEFRKPLVHAPIAILIAISAYFSI